MPELPEVETLRRGLAERLTGRTVTGIDVRLEKLFREGDPSLLVGRTVTGIRRYAKFLAFDVSGDLTMIIHLNLAGQFVHETVGGERFANGHPVPAYDAPLPHKSTRLILTFDDGATLYMTDIRTFAFGRVLPTADANAWLATQKRGPDALESALSADELGTLLVSRPRLVMKALLLDQSVLAGIGNIYADEALHRAAIHPLRTAGSLTPDEVRLLLTSIRSVLQQAVDEGVAKVLNGKAVPGAHLPTVHGREGLPCPACGETIVRIQVTNRSTYYCPACQQPVAP